MQLLYNFFTEAFKELATLNKETQILSQEGAINFEARAEGLANISQASYVLATEIVQPLTYAMPNVVNSITNTQRDTVREKYTLQIAYFHKYLKLGDP